MRSHAPATLLSHSCYTGSCPPQQLYLPSFSPSVPPSRQVLPLLCTTTVQQVLQLCRAAELLVHCPPPPVSVPPVAMQTVQMRAYRAKCVTPGAPASNVLLLKTPSSWSALVGARRIEPYHPIRLWAQWHAGQSRTSLISRRAGRSAVELHLAAPQDCAGSNTEGRSAARSTHVVVVSRLPPAAPQAVLFSHRNRCPRRDGRLLRQARAAYGGAQACAAVSAAPGSAAAGQGGHFRRHSDISQLSGASASQPAARPGPALGGRRCGAGEGPGRLRACLGPPSSSGSRLPGIMPPGRLRPLSHGGRERGPLDKGGAGAHGPPRCGPQQVVQQCWAGWHQPGAPASLSRRVPRCQLGALGTASRRARPRTPRSLPKLLRGLLCACQPARSARHRRSRSHSRSHHLSPTCGGPRLQDASREALIAQLRGELQQERDTLAEAVADNKELISMQWQLHEAVEEAVAAKQALEGQLLELQEQGPSPEAAQREAELLARLEQEEGEVERLRAALRTSQDSANLEVGLGQGQGLGWAVPRAAGSGAGNSRWLSPLGPLSGWQWSGATSGTGVAGPATRQQLRSSCAWSSRALDKLRCCHCMLALLCSSWVPAPKKLHCFPMHAGGPLHGGPGGRPRLCQRRGGTPGGGAGGRQGAGGCRGGSSFPSFFVFFWRG